MSGDVGPEFAAPVDPGPNCPFCPAIIATHPYTGSDVRAANPHRSIYQCERGRRFMGMIVRAEVVA